MIRNPRGLDPLDDLLERSQVRLRNRIGVSYSHRYAMKHDGDLTPNALEDDPGAAARREVVLANHLEPPDAARPIAQEVRVVLRSQPDSVTNAHGRIPGMPRRIRYRAVRAVM